MNRWTILLIKLLYYFSSCQAQDYSMNILSNSYLDLSQQYLLNQKPENSTSLKMLSVPFLSQAHWLQFRQTVRIPKSRLHLQSTVQYQTLGKWRRYDADLGFGRWFGHQVSVRLNWGFRRTGLPIYGYQNRGQASFQIIYQSKSWVVGGQVGLDGYEKWKHPYFLAHLLYHLNRHYSMEVIWLQSQAASAIRTFSIRYSENGSSYRLELRDGPGMALYWQGHYKKLQWQLGFHFHPLYQLYPSNTWYVAY